MAQNMTKTKKQAVVLEYDLGDGPHKIVIPPPVDAEPGPDDRVILVEEGKPKFEGTWAEVKARLEADKTNGGKKQ